MNLSVRQVEIIALHCKLINPASIKIIEGYSYQYIDKYAYHVKVSIMGSTKPLLIIETDPDTSAHSETRDGIAYMGFNVERIARIERDDEGGCPQNVYLWLVTPKLPDVDL